MSNEAHNVFNTFGRGVPDGPGLTRRPDRNLFSTPPAPDAPPSGPRGNGAVALAGAGGAGDLAATDGAFAGAPDRQPGESLDAYLRRNGRAIGRNLGNHFFDREYARSPEPTLNPEEIAARLGVTETAYSFAIRKRHVPGLTLGRYRWSDVTRLLRAQIASGSNPLALDVDDLI